jgi:molybdopterin/thiamine biosynthesis adenylyltransferase
MNGIIGQEELLYHNQHNSSILVIVAGGIGSTVLLYLAGAGIPTIGIMDLDNVELTNLHRQIIHTMSSMGTKKAALCPFLR